MRTLYPGLRVESSPGLRKWAPAQLEPIIGLDVEVQDYYGSFRVRVTGITVSDRSGAAVALHYSTDTGQTREVSIEYARKIIVL